MENGVLYVGQDQWHFLGDGTRTLSCSIAKVDLVWPLLLINPS